METSSAIWTFEDAVARFEEMASLSFEKGPQFFLDENGSTFVLLPKTEYDQMVAAYEARP